MSRAQLRTVPTHCTVAHSPFPHLPDLGVEVLTHARFTPADLRRANADRAAAWKKRQSDLIPKEIDVASDIDMEEGQHDDALLEDTGDECAASLKEIGPSSEDDSQSGDQDVHFEIRNRS